MDKQGDCYTEVSDEVVVADDLEQRCNEALEAAQKQRPRHVLVGFVIDNFAPARSRGYWGVHAMFRDRAQREPLELRGKVFPPPGVELEKLAGEDGDDSEAIAVIKEWAFAVAASRKLPEPILMEGADA